MLKNFSSPFQLNKKDSQKLNEIFRLLEQKYQKRPDPWGLNLDVCKKSMRLLLPMYKYYFKVQVHGQEHVKDKPFMIVSNHSGQIPIDGILLTIAFAWDVSPPRILRGMVERFMVKMPFLGDWAAQSGSILGDRKNCQYLIEQGETILAFPEGVKGISKSTQDFYKLQRFTNGFFRLALQNDLDILPVAVVGAEEMYPFVFHAKKLAKVFGLPSVPITPLFPLAGPLGILPLPSPIDIYIGQPYRIKGNVSKNASDKIINQHIMQLHERIKGLMHRGLVKRRPFFDSIRLPLFQYLRKHNRQNQEGDHD